MELWIRSQDKKKLYNVKNLELDNLETGICYESRDNFVLLGKYKSKERALEVLDEIQNKFKIICTSSTGGEYMLAKNLIPIVYEMPKE